MAFALKLELLLFAILEFILLILLAVGSAMPVMQSSNNNEQYTMWERRFIQNQQLSRVAISDVVNCEYTTEKLKVMAAFSILSIACCLMGLVFSILDVLHRPTHKWATEAFGLFVWLCALIVWAVGLGTFRLPLCGPGHLIPSEINWTLEGGFILYATSWALLTLSLPAMFVIKLHIRPTYWTEQDAVADEEGAVPVDALRRKKSKRSFIAEDPQRGAANRGDTVQKYLP